MFGFANYKGELVPKAKVALSKHGAKAFQMSFRKAIDE